MVSGCGSIKSCDCLYLGLDLLVDSLEWLLYRGTSWMSSLPDMSIKLFLESKSSVKWNRSTSLTLNLCNVVLTVSFNKHLFSLSLYFTPLRAQHYIC